MIFDHGRRNFHPFLQLSLLERTFCPHLCHIFFVFQFHISKKLPSPSVRNVDHFPVWKPSFLWASWLDMKSSDESWRILRLLLPQNRIPRRCREGVCPASRFNSGSLASCYWHTVLVTPQVLDFFWLTQKGARPSCDLWSFFPMWPWPWYASDLCHPWPSHPRDPVHDPVILETPSMTQSSSWPRHSCIWLLVIIMTPSPICRAPPERTRSTSGVTHHASSNSPFTEGSAHCAYDYLQMLLLVVQMLLLLLVCAFIQFQRLLLLLGSAFIHFQRLLPAVHILVTL